MSRHEVHMEIMALVPGLEAGHDYDHAHRLILARLQELTAESQRNQAKLKAACMEYQIHFDQMKLEIENLKAGRSV